MKLKFKTFSLKETRTIRKSEPSFFGGMTTYIDIPIYKTEKDLYQAICDFSESVNIVSISGSLNAESTKDYMSGDIIVWYRDLE